MIYRARVHVDHEMRKFASLQRREGDTSSGGRLAFLSPKTLPVDFIDGMLDPAPDHRAGVHGQALRNSTYQIPHQPTHCGAS